MSLLHFALRLGGCCTVRGFSTAPALYSSKSEKLSALSMLRKKTGISISKVKGALERFDDNVKEAEEWLLAEAKKEGWARAQKLQTRPMSQGLIGLINIRGSAAMLEVNCETDFVARNATFQTLVSAATMACYEHGKASGLSKVSWNAEELSGLTTSEGVVLKDLLSQTTGIILENMALRRAVFYSPDEKDTFTGAYIHFAGQDIMSVPRDVLMGRYAGLVRFTHDKPPPTTTIGPDGSEDDNDDTSLTCYEIGHQLAQHIVGMNPRKIGDPATDKPRRNKDKETKLVFQEFLLDEDVMVKDYLEENQVEVLDFVRFGLGEEEEVIGEETDDEGEDTVEEMTGEVEQDSDDSQREAKKEQ